MFNSVSSIIFYIVFNVVIQSISMNDGAVKWQPSSKQYSFIKPHQGKKIYIAHPTFFPPQPFFLTFSHCTAMVAQDASPYGQAGTALYHHMVTMTSCAPVIMANKTTMSCQTCHEKPTQILVLMGDWIDFWVEIGREILGLGEMLVARIWCVWAFKFWLGNLTWVK